MHLFFFKFEFYFSMKTNFNILKDINSRSSNTLMETLSIEFIDIGEDYITCKMPVNKKVHQPDGILHGGATAALVETAGSFASRYFIGNKNVSIRGIEITTNHVKSISSGYVFATARSIHMGRTMQIWEVEVKDKQNNLISIGKLTTLSLNKK